MTSTYADGRSIEERVYDCLRRLAILVELGKSGHGGRDRDLGLEEYLGDQYEPNANEALIASGMEELAYECLHALAPILSAPVDILNWSPPDDEGDEDDGGRLQSGPALLQIVPR
jgi:hypothetical protein